MTAGVAQQRYDRSPKGLARYARYNATAKGRARTERYRASQLARDLCVSGDRRPIYHGASSLYCIDCPIRMDVRYTKRRAELARVRLGLSVEDVGHRGKARPQLVFRKLGGAA